MIKRLALLPLVYCCLLLLIPAAASADNDLHSRADVVGFLEKASETQISLSEKDMSLDEMKQSLSHYFTDSYQQLFLKENAVKAGGKYRIYGSDFAPYYIPFKAISDPAKITRFDGNIYVVEYFKARGEGPVSYEDHYEAIRLTQEGGMWKVSDYYSENVPEEVIKNAYSEKAKNKPKAKASKQKKLGNAVSGQQSVEMFLKKQPFLLEEVRKPFSRQFEKNIGLIIL
ncbi:DUF3993 domain-containing protein [Mesobacillus zeae]|uniref:DUF3993 domain-containing protein n=1 Tax=Mesobacillus zeae TaxID=1917180 RepID=A0A398BK65_9BACI|nr:DUF3993 domain-containing protein [Mesobacillus zeae]RID87826.1 DUF3993 domain-containing protein [Mesobacillus zeae]